MTGLPAITVLRVALTAVGTLGAVAGSARGDDSSGPVEIPVCAMSNAQDAAIRSGQLLAGKQFDEYALTFAGALKWIPIMADKAGAAAKAGDWREVADALNAVDDCQLSGVRFSRYVPVRDGVGIKPVKLVPSLPDDAASLRMSPVTYRLADILFMVNKLHESYDKYSSQPSIGGPNDPPLSARDGQPDPVNPPLPK